MKRLLAPLAVALALVLWIVSDVRLADPPRRQAAQPPLPTSAPPAPVASVPPLSRDPFRFADEAPLAMPEAPSSDWTAATAAPATTSAPAPLVRLSGFVRRAGRLLAVLSTPAGTLVLGTGEEAEGYRVVAIDEEAGVRVRIPDGGELDLELLP